MSEFAKENLNECDYDTLNATWECQLRQLGWQRTWNADGPAWRSSEDEGGEGQSLYDAWAQATGTPTDLKLGIDKEPPAPVYRKPV
jgi:hypothetical protein